MKGSEFYELDEAAQGRALARLAERALEHWGLTGSTLTLLKYRENAVFRVDCAGGDRYALRIHRHGYHSDGGLRSELAWMKALGDAGIRVPEVMADRSGDLFCHVDAPEVPEPRQVDVFAWIDGSSLAAIAGAGGSVDVAASYRSVGELAAQLHNQAVAWQPPEGFVRHAWDVEALVGESPHWGRFWDLAALSPGQRSLLLETREVLRRDLAAYAARPESAERFSLIHADFVTDNLMLGPGGLRLIDFDDAGYGWHLFELATALYFELDEPFYPEAFGAMIAGYRAHRDLPEAELSFMALFYLARSTTYLGWVHTRSETTTARELTPLLVEKCTGLAEAYLRR